MGRFIACLLVLTFAYESESFGSLKLQGMTGLSIRHRTKLHGIPKMFRWLTEQYPSINKKINQGVIGDESDVVDNLYLDMNGIIHMCTHNNDAKIEIFDEKRMLKKIMMYTDRLYKLVKPRRMLYLAVDGVAPRAKMNQQRSRRFRR